MMEQKDGPLEELAKEISNLDEFAETDVTSEEYTSWQNGMSLLQAKLGHEECLQLTRIANLLEAFSGSLLDFPELTLRIDAQAANTAIQRQKVDALQAKIDSLEALIEGCMSPVILSAKSIEKQPFDTGEIFGMQHERG